MKNSQKTSKHQKGDFRARKTLQTFVYSVLRRIRALLSSYGSSTVKRKQRVELRIERQKFEYSVPGTSRSACVRTRTSFLVKRSVFRL